MFRNLLFIVTLTVVPVLAQTGWTHYTNAKFGYSLELPQTMILTNRAADGSGLTWQTGTVRIQVSGANNRYEIKPQDYFDRMRQAAGDQIVEQHQGTDPARQTKWLELLYTKDGRRIHQKTYVGDGVVNSVEFSYAYRYRKEKESIGARVLDSFVPGDLKYER